jgi:hypothetical protein
MFDATIGIALRRQPGVMVHGLHNGSLQRYLAFMLGAAW